MICGSITGMPSSHQEQEWVVEASTSGQVYPTSDHESTFLGNYVQMENETLNTGSKRGPPDGVSFLELPIKKRKSEERESR